MKKSSFVTLILGTVSGVLFALGMCMALLPEWEAFAEGVAFGSCGLVLGAVTFLIWCKMENKRMPKMSRKNALTAVFGVLGVLVLGIGMCMCLVWEQFVWGTLVGIVGIVMLLSLIPMVKGVK